MKIDRGCIGAIMHDLGLTERFDGDQRYEVDGADAAREFFLQHGLPKDRAEVVWDAIAGNWFEPRMLETGYSRHPAKCRVSRCSVHVYSQCYKVAALGNITVHPNFRGQGLGTILCARLCQHYYPVETIGLNVKADNTSAICCYTKLGFEMIVAYKEYSLLLNRR